MKSKLIVLLLGTLIFTACGAGQEATKENPKEEEEVKDEPKTEYKEQEMPVDSTQKDTLKTNQ